MGGAGGAHDHDHGQMYSPEEIARREAKRWAEFRYYGFKTNAELSAKIRAEAKRLKMSEKEGSIHFIGPPNPWRKYRKRGRWL
jgi:galactose-1-phosphate uridylyltransferase